ncbi:hypothetical protein K474DRAFT_640459 [Panus rudis PR-1116 ss-1]|nr:hypothetical protein K474DRAFT_640459 [Panus rudis PR-1116 ss-1]
MHLSTFTGISVTLIISSILHSCLASPLTDVRAARAISSIGGLAGSHGRNDTSLLSRDTSSNGIFAGGKLGLAWPNGADPALKNFVTGNTGALYTWSPDCPSNSPLPCYRMLWGDNQIQQFQNDVKASPGKNDVILGFNEPNQAGQSNMDPQHGCALWKQYIQPKKELGYTLVSPATSSAPNGFTWVQEFMNCCTGCTIDAIAVHWYDVSADGFIAYLEKWHNAFNKPILVTEYAVQNFNGGPQATMDEVVAFHKKVGPYMLSQPWIAKFFPFGFMREMQGVNPDNQLMDSNGNPTELGRMIINNAY